jgi:hypothetical protein
MKRIINISLFLILYLAVYGQGDKTNLIQNLENEGVPSQDTVTATIKSASRLFADRNNISSVIMVIPEGSVVSVIGSDGTYLHVVFDEYEGYIYANDAEINKAPVKESRIAREEEVQNEMPVQPQQASSRLEYLENKYGSRVGDRIYEGKIWKGMTAEMVKDSWGSPRKINKVISENVIREEWQYGDTWLYIQNNILTRWGPVK